MQQNYNDILLQILDIINYPQDKEKFIIDFNTLNQEETIVNLYDRLSREEQEKIINTNDLDELRKYIHQDVITTELIKVSADSLGKFIEDISTTLNENQKEKIIKLISPI